MPLKIDRVDYGRQFLKQYKKAPLPIKFTFRQRLALLRQNEFHPLLNNHALTGQYASWRSINITGDWRAHYKLLVDSKGTSIILFGAFGTHSQLYR